MWFRDMEVNSKGICKRKKKLKAVASFLAVENDKGRGLLFFIRSILELNLLYILCMKHSDKSKNKIKTNNSPAPKTRQSRERRW